MKMWILIIRIFPSTDDAVVNNILQSELVKSGELYREFDDNCFLPNALFNQSPWTFFNYAVDGCELLQCWNSLYSLDRS